MTAGQQALGMHCPCTDTAGTTSTPGHASPLCGAGDRTHRHFTVEPSPWPLSSSFVIKFFPSKLESLYFMLLFKSLNCQKPLVLKSGLLLAEPVMKAVLCLEPSLHWPSRLCTVLRSKSAGPLHFPLPASPYTRTWPFWLLWLTWLPMSISMSNVFIRASSSPVFPTRSDW